MIVKRGGGGEGGTRSCIDACRKTKSLNHEIMAYYDVPRI
jgi:hypothetical protein